MKKLLTVLLTFVMAVCLINLNNSHTKAEDTNADPVESTYLKAGIQIYNIINPLPYLSEIKHLKFCANKPDGITGTEYDISLDDDGTAMLGYNSTNNTLYVYGAKKYIFHEICGSMFSEMPGLVDIDFNNMIDTSNVSNFESMFYNDLALKTLDLSCFSKPVFKSETLRTTGMFKMCMNLKTIFVKKDGFDMSNITSGNSAGAFDGCSKLIGGNGTKFNSSYKDKTYGLIDKEGQAGYFTDIDNGPIYCKSISYDSTGWKNGTTPFTADDFDIFGIDYNSTNGTATFTKSLTGSGDNGTIFLNADVNIVFGSDNNAISINNTEGYPALGINNSLTSATIDGGGKKVKMTTTSSSTAAAIESMGTSLTLKNIILECENNGSVYPAIRVKNLSLTGDTSIELTNNGTFSALQVMDSEVVFSVANKILIGNASGVSTDPTSKLKRKGVNPNIGAYCIDDGTDTFARYIYMENKSPKPTPSPSEPKDESCEKVIGPTWHWNNDKGICEDYGVVGTSTR